MPTITEIRQQYPQYNDMSDGELADRLHQKFYADMPKAEFMSRIGMAEQAAPQPEQEQGWRDYARGIVAQTAQGILGNYGDELKGYVRAVPALFDDRNYAEEAAKITQQQRAEEQQFARQNPKASLAANVTGAVMSGVAVPGSMLRAATVPGQIAKAGAVGAGYGAISGSGAGEGVMDRLGQGAIGAAVGGVTGAAGQAAFTGASSVVNRMLGRQSGLPTPAAARQQIADEFSVPLTRGQATGNVNRQAFEEAARNNAKGELAGQIMRGFDARQEAALREAEQSILGRFAGQAAPAESAPAAAESVLGGVRSAAQGMKAARNAAYKQAQDMGATIAVDAFQDLPSRFAKALDDKAILLHPQTTPKTQAFIERFRDGVERFAQTGPDGQVVGVSLNWAERQREVLNKLARGTQDGTDRTALFTLKDALDDWTDGVVERSLISGDPAALEALKQARGIARDYALRFRSQGKFDDAGKTIERMLQKDDLTGQDVANLLWGSTQVGGSSGRPAHLAGRLKTILGEGSEEWSAIRQGTWLRITEPPARGQLGPQALATRIKEFVAGKGSPLAKQLYSEQERQMMSRYADTLRFLVPAKEATNPSRSGFRAMQMGSTIMSALGAGAGASAAGPVGAAAGGLAVKSVMSVKPALQAALATSRAPSRTLQVTITAPASKAVGEEYLGLRERPALPAY